MKVEATIKGDRISFSQMVVFKKPEMELELELLDEDVLLYSEQDMESMSLTQLAHLVLDNLKVDEEGINRDYKDILMDVLMEKST